MSAPAIVLLPALKQWIGTLLGITCVLAVVSQATAQGTRGTRSFVLPGVMANKWASPQPADNEGDTVNKSTDEVQVGKLIVTSEAAPRIINIDEQGRGETEDPAKWLTTVLLRDGTSSCTATVVGPLVVLTAAHCVTRAGGMQIALDPPIALTCERHPSFAPIGHGIFFDYALCLLSREFPRTVILPAKVSVRDLTATLEREYRTDENQRRMHDLIREVVLPKIVDKENIMPSLEAAIGTATREHVVYYKRSHEELVRGLARTLALREKVEVRLAQREFQLYNGQTSGDTLQTLVREAAVRFERLSLQPEDGRFRIGAAATRRVLMVGYGCIAQDETGGNDGNLRAGIGRISQFGELWLTIGDEFRRHSAILCAGDSGGPAFKMLSNDVDGARRIVAINARNIKPFGRVLNRSFVAKTTSVAFRRFFAMWWNRHSRPHVCGVGVGNAVSCHD